MRVWLLILKVKISNFPCSGYMAPEYALEGRFSEKSDVFSFGVMMLEIATGTRNISFHEEGSLSLLGHVSQIIHYMLLG